MPPASQKIKVAVDVAVFAIHRESLSVLLLQMRREPFGGRWALPGGLVGNRETPEAAAARELTEKTGLRNVYLEQLYTFGALDRDPAGRVITVAYLALIPSEAVELRTTPKYSGIGWFSVKRLPPLAFDHRDIVRYAVQRLRNKLAYTNVVYSILPAAFTLGELQHAYATILEADLDPRNFRKRILSLGLVTPTGVLRGGRHRPARLYRFVSRRPREVNVL